MPDWSNPNNAVTYTYNVEQVPNPKTNPYFDFNLYLVPGQDMPYGGWWADPGGIDWDCNSGVQFQVVTTPQNGTVVFLAYKTNLVQSAGDTMFNGIGSLLIYTNPVSILGTWSLSTLINGDNSATFTVTAPDGSTNGATMEPLSVAYFQNVMASSWGMGGLWRVQDVPQDIALPYMTSANNLGLSALIGGASATVTDLGAQTTNVWFADNFGADTLDASWNLNPCENSTYLQIPQSAGAIVYWNTTSGKWDPQTAGALTGSWATASTNASFTTQAGTRGVFVRTNNIPAGSEALFRLKYDPGQ